MTFLLLTGAGFSRNWGGWLANEAFEYLLSCPELTSDLRRRLWRAYETGGGFEQTLADLQAEHIQNKTDQTESALRLLEISLSSMFEIMNDALKSNYLEASLFMPSAMVRFDAIFTLNQDLFLEYHYLNDEIAKSAFRTWSGWQLPGTEDIGPRPERITPSMRFVPIRRQQLSRS